MLFFFYYICFTKIKKVMKKIYLLAVMTAVGTMSFAQSSQRFMQKADFTGKAKAENLTITEKAPGISLWSDTFDDPSNWVIDGDGQQGAWEIGTNADPAIVTDYTFYGPMASTTAADGFAYFDGVPFLVSQPPAVDPQNAWIEMANAIDMTGYQRVIFSFEQRYMAFNSDNTIVEVSLDNGATWTGSVDVNVDVPTNNDPAVQNTIFQEFVVNAATQVKFRFRWENPSDDDQFGSGYAWMVDDVNIATLPDNDIDASNLYFGTEGLHYYQIPETQIAPIDFTVIARNAGVNDQVGVALEATETGGSGYVGTSTPAAIAAGDIDSLVVNSAFTPSGQGTYDIEFAILNDSVDDIPSNNMMAGYSFEVGEYIYARDNGSAGGSFAPDMDFEAGNLYDIWQNQDLTGIDVRFGASLDEAGLETFARIYEIDTDGNFVLLAETPLYNTQTGDAGSIVTYTFENPVSLAAGNTYLAAVGSFATGMAVSVAGTSADQTSFLYGDLGSGGIAWYFANSTPMVRMNFDPQLSVENNEVSNLNVSQNFPNPFSTETTVEYTLENASEVSYTLVDLAGNTILEVNEGNVMAGKHAITIDGSSLANGVYYFNMTAGGAQTTHKMIVNK